MIKYRITEIDKEIFFLKVGAIIYLNLQEERVYSEDMKNWATLEFVEKLNINGEQIKEETEKPYNNDWIPCSERLPEDEEDVLVWFEYFRYGNFNCLYQTYGISSMFEGRWSGFVNGSSGWDKLRIIAWQPLPDPYIENTTEAAV